MGYILSKLWNIILEYLYAKNNTKIQVNYGIYFEQTMGYNTGIFICKNNTKIQVNYGIHFEQTMGLEVLRYLCIPYNTS